MALARVKVFDTFLRNKLLTGRAGSDVSLLRLQAFFMISTLGLHLSRIHQHLIGVLTPLPSVRRYVMHLPVVGFAHTESRLLERFFNVLVDTAPVMIHVVDQDFNIIKVNQRWLDVMGYERAEVLGRNPIDFLTEDSRARAIGDIIPNFWHAMADRSVGVDFVTRDGQILELLLDAELTRDIAGNLYGFALMYDSHDPTQWAEASVTMKALREFINKPQTVEGHLLSEKSDKWEMRFPEAPQQDFISVEAERSVTERSVSLTRRELEVLRALAWGARNKEIADQLSLSVRTVRFHIENLFRKLEVKGRTQAARVAFERRYLKPGYRN